MINIKDYGLNHWINHPDVTISINKNQQESDEDGDLRRTKELWLFIISISVFCIVLLFCIGFIIFNPNSSYTGIALNGIIGLSLGLIGYYVRGK